AAAGFGKVFRVEEVRVDALRVDRKRLLQQFAGLVLVAEAHWPAGHLVVQHAEAVVGGAVERLAVDADGLLVDRFRLLDQAQRTEPSLFAGPRTDDDAFPDQRLAATGEGLADLARLGGERFEPLLALGGRGLVADDFPVALQFGHGVLDRASDRGHRPAEGKGQQAREHPVHVGFSPERGGRAWACRLRRCRAKAPSSNAPRTPFRRTARRSGKPRKRSAASLSISASSAAATTSARSIEVPVARLYASTAASLNAVRVLRGARI